MAVRLSSQHEQAITLKPQSGKLVYTFGLQEPTAPLDPLLLGGKGRGLAEMSLIGLPVPPGFTLTTEACHLYRQAGKKITKEIQEQVLQSIALLEKQLGMQFGCGQRPLLLSVRSGAPASMPGMMDTVLNLGLNDDNAKALASYWQNERLAYDCYRRFIMMFSEIVHGVPKLHFEQAFHILKLQENVENDVDLSPESFKKACQLFKSIHDEHSSTPFPYNPIDQLYDAISAVFNSWDSERALLYRQLNHIPSEWGTAVNIQLMVFGNKNNRSATGVGFTRDPATGHNHFYGEFLLNAQGEEVVAGIRTPHPINLYQKNLIHSPLTSLEELMPQVYQQLLNYVQKLETHYLDMQDIEFTIDDGKLYMLQTRKGKRTGFAAVRMAVEMCQEGMISEKEALLRVEPNQLMQLLAPVFDPQAKKEAAASLVTKGINAGPGAASGRAVFSSAKAVEMRKEGIGCILIREEACPDDFPGMVAAEGILTLRGGSTSHAAVVARGMGKPCVVGCSQLTFDSRGKTLCCKDRCIQEGDAISIDGQTGEVFFCSLNTSPSEVVQVLVTHSKAADHSLVFRQYETLMKLADKYRHLRIRTNSDTPHDSAVARAFGAEGIGLCRTEHMFMDLERLNDVRSMFFSTRAEERKNAIDRLLPYQKKDFEGIFQAMDGRPVTIRLLDPPLHEFMPHNSDEINTLASLMGISHDRIQAIRSSIEEVNPMLGHRGCRLGITYPELTQMQVRAILSAAIEVRKKGIEVHPEIMVPLVSTVKELQHQRLLIEQVAEELFKEEGIKIPYQIGTMIELPRAALLAEQIAAQADFFSFGTNDLTQTVYGISRDDGSKFLPIYINGVKDPRGNEEPFCIFPHDPFQVLDTEGVGSLMQIAIEAGRSVKPNLKLGICGEHGGEPKSVIFCHTIGLDYVSCSPYRVPVARLAAAQAAIKCRQER